MTLALPAIQMLADQVAAERHIGARAATHAIYLLDDTGVDPHALVTVLVPTPETLPHAS